MRLLFDLESNGLFSGPEARPDFRILCGAALDVDNPERHWKWTDSKGDQSALADATREADELIGHNIAGFDVPAMELSFPGWTHRGRLFDTNAASRARYVATITKLSAKWRNMAGRNDKDREDRFPRKYLVQKSHTLEAWGYRLGLRKGAFLKDMGVQEEFSEELLDYCFDDVKLNVAVWRAMQLPDFPDLRNWTLAGSDEWESLLGQTGQRPAYPYEVNVLESEYAYYLAQQERNGVGFNKAAAEALWERLVAQRAPLERKLLAMFPPWYGPKITKGDHDPALPTRDGDWAYQIPKRSYSVEYPNPLAGREKGCAFTPIKIKEFNPGSRQQIGERLVKVYGWEPSEFTNEGLPTVSEDTLSDAMDLEPVPLLIEYLMLEKRIGQLAEGKQAWLKHVAADGLIHGAIIPAGARTNRAAHMKPNLGQVPKPKSMYGPECRGLFGPTKPGWMQIGVDASGLQLRCLAHRLAYYDGGAYAKVLLEGDPHESWRRATGLYDRENQKTASYAYLYGAFDAKLGSIARADWIEAYQKSQTVQKPPPLSAIRALGQQVRAALTTRVPGLGELTRACHGAHKRGWLKGLDGRTIVTVSEHAALCDVLQSDETQIMRRAILNFRATCRSSGWEHGKDFGHLLYVHDEVQLEGPPELAAAVGDAMIAAIRKAGEDLGVRCQLDGKAKVGKTWFDTH